MTEEEKKEWKREMNAREKKLTENQERMKKYTRISHQPQISERIDAIIENPKPKLKLMFDEIDSLFTDSDEAYNVKRTLIIHGIVFVEVFNKKLKPPSVKLLDSGRVYVEVDKDGKISGIRDCHKQPPRGYALYSVDEIKIFTVDVDGYVNDLNRPISLLEPAIKPYNQFNTISDAVVMMRAGMASSDIDEEDIEYFKRKMVNSIRG